MVVRISKSRLDAGGEQLQNAELSSPAYTTVTANSGTAYTLDLSQGSVFVITLTANCTLSFSNLPASGSLREISILLVQDDTGSRSVTWPSTIRWPSGTIPTAATTAGTLDWYVLYTTNGGTFWYGEQTGGNLQLKTGYLWAWGQNAYGQLGLGDSVNRSVPVQVSGDAVWSKVATSGSHFLAIKTDGTLWAWGYNYNGQLGLGNTTARNSPVQIGSGTTWSKVAAGTACSFALTTANTLFAWGYNESGRLGLGDTVARSSPVQVTGTTWSAITAGTHVLALQTDNSLWVWGSNVNGRLGLGDTAPRSSPVQITGTWSTISANTGHSLAITTGGQLYSWGLNSVGQLGTGDTNDRSSPVQIGWTTWSKAVANGTHSLAISTTGALYAWGENLSGQLGFGDKTRRSAPVTTASGALWAPVGAASTAAGGGMTRDGRIFEWGNNSVNGELGVGDQNARSVPTQVATNATFSQFSIGENHAAALTPTGKLFLWGRGDEGELGFGLGGSDKRSAPVQLGTSVWSQVSVGGRYTLAISEDQKLYGWGQNTSGELAANNKNNRSSPVVIDSSSWAVVSAGIGGTSAAIINGTRYLYGWGVNTSGQLGLGDKINRSALNVISYAEWATVSTNYSTMAAIKRDRTLWVSGLNTSGQLGLKNVINRSTLVQVGTDTNWAQISTGNSTMAAITTDGKLFAWGVNSSGQLGVGDASDRSSPVQVGTDTSWSYVSAGYLHMVAVKTDGTFWTWGYNADGRLGIGDLINRSSPVQVSNVPGSDTWTSVAAGYAHSLGTKAGSQFYVWGSNYRGQLGLNDLRDRSSPIFVGFTGNPWSSVTAGENVSGGIS